MVYDRRFNNLIFTLGRLSYAAFKKTIFILLFCSGCNINFVVHVVDSKNLAQGSLLKLVVEQRYKSAVSHSKQRLVCPPEVRNVDKFRCLETLWKLMYFRYLPGLM